VAAPVRRLALWQGYLAAGGLLCLLYLVVPPFAGSAPLMALMGGSAVLAVVAGIRRHRPAEARSWVWFGIGLGLFWLGDLYTYGYARVIGHELPFPSLGDGIYITVYPALMVGLLTLVRHRNPGGDRAGMIDSLIMTLGLALLAWVGLIAPYLHAGHMALEAKLVSIGYPLGDVLLLAAGIRLAVAGGLRNPSVYLLGASVVALLATDFVYGVATLHGAYHHQVWLDAGWVAFYVLWGAAALHPAMRGLGEPVADQQPRLTPVRLLLLSAASLIAPALELAWTVPHGGLDMTVVVVASGLLFGLVVVRMAGLVRQQERSVARERVLMEEIHRKTSEAWLSSLVQHSSDIITVLDAEARIVYQSPSVQALLGYAPEELVGSRFDRLVVPGEHTRLLHLLADAAPAPGATETRRVEGALRHRDGSARQFEIQHTNLLHDPHVRGIVLNGRDVSERRAFEQQLEHQAFHDPVTGLANRALFAERVRHAVARARREGGALAVVFLDVDDFKTINDSLGHAAGDGVLEQIGRRLAGAIRSTDTAARFGGDEFAILLEDVRSAADATDSAERMLDALRAPLRLEGKPLTVRSSLGIAVAAGAGAPEAEELIRNADVAMYIAKRDGKGGHRLFEPAMHEDVLARLELRADLQRALDGGQFEVYYQPVVRLEDQEVAGLEALLRWRHPERGIVGPDEFIPLAEEMGAIVPLGRWVLREACREARGLQRLGGTHAPLSVAVNLSVQQIQRSDIVADVRDALAESGLPAPCLTLEVTETVMMTETELVVERLEALKRLGVRLAMDDFGTGYSSLSYLSRLPVDILKMDRSFLDGGATPEASGLATAVVALGRTLHLDVVAEGIEHAEQCATLLELGCTLGQGFHFARPMDAPAVREFLRARRAHRGTADVAAA
jgi:diguanylate cyclase (GGDEF)-like protein/PAS domain S-box-containing protein